MSDNKYQDPPQWLLSVFRHFCKKEMLEDIEGDLTERYNRQVAKYGFTKARRKFFWQLLSLFRPGIIRKVNLINSKNASIMFKHNFFLSWRLLTKQKGYSAINIFGLTLSMTMAMFAMLWIQDERSYDQFHQNIDRIYRVLRHFSFGEEITAGVSICYPASTVLREDYPEIEKLVVTSHEQTLVFQREGVLAKENGIFAGPEFFEIFSWDLKRGNESEILREPSSVVLSTSLAEKYFGTEWLAKDVVGQTIQIGEEEHYRIRGVFADLPHYSSLQFDFVLSIDNYLQNRNITNWHNSNFQLYVLLDDQADVSALSAAIKDVQNQHIEGFTSDLFLHPYQDMHLRSSFENGALSVGRIEYYIRVFSIVAFLIVLISSINFTNLSIARSMQRAKEIGIRKIVGAGRMVLAGQFLWESILLVSLAFILSVSLIPFLLPLFNLLVEKQISISDLPTSTFFR